MHFTEIRQHIRDAERIRMPQALSEMEACIPLAEYLNDRFGCTYDDVSKDRKIDNEGVDAMISDTTGKYPDLYVQVTHAREYDMSPQVDIQEVDISGHPILVALQQKCSAYSSRGIYTKQIILLILGILPAERAAEIFQQYGFVDRVIEESCFDGVYYISDSVYPLKQIERPRHLK